ncbi:electron transfer flavoprotein subunit alpha/FixB family protein [Phytoactinopolyspora halotolerans]|uniref:Electron transfer flavoprotein subunit alpha/FixB family protein n=1 Tax=Phytoactinopolyspora halotolerans TaxID=1981512 RepID=A0A6L9SE52_9ACTN|nr:electron transfer flavoprotein subunit alpha/FixB family protein [Phytoactinopolyspora halotolerans]NEE02350.1 electron transfer flavoprotein subunit alpha/FixB family protein [Phytoactinopolyspora halotolerans]
MLVLVELDEHGVAPGSLEALAWAHPIARELGEPLHAAVFASGTIPPAAPGDPLVDLSLRAELARHEVSTVHTITHPELADYSPERWGESLAQLIAGLRPTAVVAAGTERGTETMAQAAARADLPLAVNCTELERSGAPGAEGPDGPDGRSWRLARIRQGGMLLEDAELTAPIAIVTLAPGAAESTAAPNAAAEPADVPEMQSDVPAVAVERFEPEFGDRFVASRLVGRTTRDGGVSLATARVVVSGGRGVGSADGFGPLEELAKLTGGAVGCSRVVTNNGWRPHSDQVGQTGTKVNPDLYIACGISGATQHWVGCMSSKAILAINTDPDAPMVKRATYAVIGDVADIVPAVVDEIHRRAQ